MNGVLVATYDDQDRLLTYGGSTYTYTDNGELLTKTNGIDVTSYDYDVLGNLLSVTNPDGTLIEYLIDPRGRRVGKKVDGVLIKGWLYKDKLNPIAELDAIGNIVSRFIYADRSNIPSYMVKAGVTYRIITNQLGSPLKIIDIVTGAIVQEMSYDVWGNLLTDSNPDFQPFAFAGGIYDVDTKLTRFGFRDYDANSARWTSKDPIDFGGGDTNLFGYVSNDPIGWVDIDGLVKTHNTNKTPSNRPKHQAGESRRARDAGNEKGDKNRRAPRQKPKGYNGSWPPKQGGFITKDFIKFLGRIALILFSEDAGACSTISCQNKMEQPLYDPVFQEFLEEYQLDPLDIFELNELLEEELKSCKIN